LVGRRTRPRGEFALKPEVEIGGDSHCARKVFAAGHAWAESPPIGACNKRSRRRKGRRRPLGKRQRRSWLLRFDQLTCVCDCYAGILDKLASALQQPLCVWRPPQTR
jgi:hypothetical protein